MKPGDMVQIQRPFRLFARELSNADPSKFNDNIESIITMPGEVYLLLKLERHNEEYPQYDYITVELLVSGKTWLTTVTTDDVYEIEQFIRKYDFKNKDIKNFESPALMPRR
jgi:hypothetical protein